MTRISTYKSLLAASFCCVAVCSACVNDENGMGPDNNHKQTGAFVTFCFKATSSESLPINRILPGEIGDGLEMGQDYENNISSAVAFFFKANNGVNSPENTPIDAICKFVNVYKSSQSAESVLYTTEPVQVDLEDGTYQVIVIANPPQNISWDADFTLRDVRDYIIDVAWNESTGSYSNFVMSSAKDANIVLTSDNSKDNPATAQVDVERMAARLDYMADGVYQCTDNLYEGATVEITGAALVNNLTAGSYLVKRVADDVTGSNTVFLGDELAVSGVQTNYVLDPWTQSKTETNNSFNVGDNTGVTASGLYGVWFKDGSQDPNWWSSYVKPGVEITSDGETWRRIGYTMENTVGADEVGSRYSTGVVFKAKFHPHGLVGYNDGDTFFAYGSRLYVSMEDMMADFYGADFRNGEFPALDACTTWQQVNDFIADNLLDNDPSGYYDFMIEQAEGKPADEQIADPASLKWKAYMHDRCGYEKASDGSVVIDIDNKITRIALKPYGVRTYEDATCYYTWWVRHYDDNNDDINSAMEYAIVRNNIYKLSVKSVYSLGGDVPEEGNELYVDVYVNDWLLLENENLPM